jgi:flagellar hook-associated protein 3 FlgL
MLERATEAQGRAREQLADAGRALSSGVRVEVPSDDPSGWAEGARTEARQIASSARGEAIGRAQGLLLQTDSALDAVSSALAQVLQIAVQMSNDLMTAADRQTGAAQVIALRDAVVAAANRRGDDGTYLLSGSITAAPPFSTPSGYSGDGATRAIETQEGGVQTVSLPGEALTAASGVDVVGALDALVTALQANDGAATRASLDPITSAIEQLGHARGEVGAYLDALAAAHEARLGLEIRLAEARARSIESDPVIAVAELSRARMALEAARVFSQQIADVLGAQRF